MGSLRLVLQTYHVKFALVNSHVGKIISSREGPILVESTRLEQIRAVALAEIMPR